MSNRVLLVLGLLLLVAGIAGLAALWVFDTVSTTPSASRLDSRYASAGERIYLSGLDTSGRPIYRTSPPFSERLLMMGGGGCASCHGTDGRGGRVRMMMSFVDAPDVTFDALRQEGFTQNLVGRAIRDGKDESGQALDEAMPRWKMTDAEVSDVIGYLKELSSR